MPQATQICSAPDCERPAAFRTRTRPTWCDEHITSKLREAGVEPLEPFAGPKVWRLCRCLQCGCETHSRFEQVLEWHGRGEPACRACYWRAWAQWARGLSGSPESLAPVLESEARARAEANGYEYLGPLTDPSLGDDPHYVRCVYCHRLSAERLGDIGWGCSCQVNPARSESARDPKESKKKALLKDSGLPAVSWWDHDANDSKLWETTVQRARREVAWKCPECGYLFVARVLDMAGRPKCPACESIRRAAWSAEYEVLKHTPVSDVSELSEAWADEADPRTVMVAGTMELRRFRCPEGHLPRITPMTYLRSGCPICRGLQTRAQYARQSGADQQQSTPPRISPEMASQWHSTRNENLDLYTISPTSRRMVWWRDPVCGHEWQDSPRERQLRQRLRCPVCRTVLDSLAWHYPELAAEWSPSNTQSAWHVRPTGQTPYVPEWVCSNDPSHVWAASLGSRAAGSGCPDCRIVGKSQVELAHFEAASAVFGLARSGATLVRPEFTHGARWTVDIAVDVPQGRTLVIEYDGAYWHAGKSATDTAKTLDLLNAGCLVVRLREHPLPPLEVEHVRCLQLTVYGEAPNPAGTIERVRQWAIAAPESCSDAG